MSTIASSLTPVRDRIGTPRSKTLRDLRERFIMGALMLCGIFSIGTTFAIIFVLFKETFGLQWLGMEAKGFFSFEDVSFWEFVTGLEWNPLLGAEKHFGIWPLVCGTLLVTAVAMTIALPLGLITAIYLSEYAPRWLRNILKPILEVIAGVPTVVFGFFALTVITPFLRFDWWQVADGAGGTQAWNPFDFGTYNAMAAGIAVGIMTLPIVTSISEDALQAVPRSLREAAYGMGATRFEVSVRVVTPAALSGIVAAFLLAIARSVGETMIVALAAGATPLPLKDDPLSAVNPASEVQPMTGYMVQIFLGDASGFGVEYYSAYAVAATLFVMTLVLTLIGHKIRNRFRQKYD